TLFNLCHLIVVGRPGFVSIGDGKNLLTEIRKEYLSRHAADASDLARQPSGCIYTVRTLLLEISASHIRSLISAGKSIRYLLPESVSEYIKSNRLYTGNL
ncbi:MAG: nicotinate-nucleotide adenylyltransferase, partial [Betaproteobacteria bacterium]|nr:nicotinate-nucleotide adenylyltransferase [Betaproteobacteria bacterium]